MIVKIQFSNINENYEYELDENITIYQIKNKIANENNLNLSSNEIKLIYAGRVLENHKTLENINFQNNHSIMALRKVNDNNIIQQETGILEKMIESNEINNLLNSLGGVVNSLNSNIIEYIRNNLDYNINNDIDIELKNEFFSNYRRILYKMNNDNDYLEFVRRRDTIGLIIHNANSLTFENYKNICNYLYQFICILNNEYHNEILKISLNSYKKNFPEFENTSNNDILKDIIEKIKELNPEDSNINAVIEINIIDLITQNNLNDDDNNDNDDDNDNAEFIEDNDNTILENEVNDEIFCDDNNNSENNIDNELNSEYSSDEEKSIYNELNSEYSSDEEKSIYNELNSEYSSDGEEVFLIEDKKSMEKLYNTGLILLNLFLILFYYIIFYYNFSF
jgi:hypothetical protein